jgi:hypothetical protein
LAAGRVVEERPLPTGGIIVASGVIIQHITTNRGILDTGGIVLQGKAAISRIL